MRQQDPALGFVGEIEQVQTEVLHELSALGWIPVIASLGVDQNGQHYNINADTVAGAVAESLSADRLVLVTDVPGILVKSEQVTQPLARATPSQLEELIAAGTIHGGMIPKVRAAAATVMHGVKVVCIVDGKAPDVLMKATGFAKGAFAGTAIVQEGSEWDGADGDVHAMADRSS